MAPLRYARYVSLALFASFVALGTGCSDTPPPKKPQGGDIDPAEQAKLEQGRKKIDQANAAINSKSYKKARKYLAEAQALGVESQRYEIEEALDKIDKHEAKAFAKEAEPKLKNKDCAGAFSQIADKIKERSDTETFAREMRHTIATDALKCVQGFVDDSVLSMKYVDARKLLDSDTTKQVLGEAAAKKAQAELEQTIEESLRAQLGDDIKAKKWPKAVEKIDGFVKRGDADDAQGLRLLGTVRDAVAPEVTAEAAKGVGANDATAVLRQVDATVKLMRWEALTGEEAELQKGKAMPPELLKKYRALTAWVEGVRVRIKTLKKPEKRWTHGKIAVFQPAHSDADAKRDVPHATQVWVIGASKDKSLITTTDPGSATLAQSLDNVLGWVATDRLASENTADWLVPDDQLKGERVWGPLRSPDVTYELGMVTDVSGKDISVKRLADDQIIKLPRNKLRSGRLSAGTKVITFCTAKDQPAQVLEVLPTGSAKLKCDSGEEKEDVLASLRSKADLLPPSK